MSILYFLVHGGSWLITFVIVGGSFAWFTWPLALVKLTDLRETVVSFWDWLKSKTLTKLIVLREAAMFCWNWYKASQGSK